MNRILYELQKYWDVKNIPKHDLSHDRDELITIKGANLLTIALVVSLFTIVIILALGGVF